MLCQIRQIQTKQGNLINSKFSQSINVAWRTCDRNGKDISSCFNESKKILGCLMKRETCQLKKNCSMVQIYFLKLWLLDLG